MSHASVPAPTTILTRFEAADEVRESAKGKLEVLRIAGQTLGRATYQPGWKWSEHVGPLVGCSRCTTEHLLFVVSGHATVAFADGRIDHLTPGTVAYVPPEPHDSWVVGGEPYVSIHLMAVEEFAKPR